MLSGDRIVGQAEIGALPRSDHESRAIDDDSRSEIRPRDDFDGNGVNAQNAWVTHHVGRLIGDVQHVSNFSTPPVDRWNSRLVFPLQARAGMLGSVRIDVMAGGDLVVDSTTRSRSRVRARSCACAFSLSLSLGQVFAPTIAHAAPKANDSKPDQAAAKAFEQGQKAFKTGDYRKAGEKFEQAYELAPHPSPLWNAARAWHRAHEPVRAANLYAKYLRIAPEGARDRNHAISGLKELSAKLGLLTVNATDVTDIRVDGKPIEGSSIYVLPGEHIVEGRSGETPIRVTRVITAGEAMSVALVPPSPPPPAAVAEHIEEKPEERRPDAAKLESRVPSKGGLSPTWFYVAAGATVVVGGVATWSGLDTLNRKDDFLSSPDQSKLDDGRSSQTRTNILLGATAGLAIATVVLALVVDWKGAPATGPVQVGFTGNGVGGTF